MDNNQGNKKCFCARCFLPVDAEERVDIENQNFHRICSMCCVCRTIPTTLKMFYGHVFCSDCFKTHVLTRFKGENPRFHSNSWWMQWAPGPKTNDTDVKESTESKTSKNSTEDAGKRCICVRCLQPVREVDRIDIANQSFHPQCATCYCCHTVPTSNLKIYYGQVFCEDCFHRHVMNKSSDNPSEFFKTCFQQWQNNPQFAEQMREFMASSSRDQSPLVFMMQDQQAPFCRCGTGAQEWFQPSEPKKSATPAAISIAEESAWDLSFENRTEASDILESIDESAKPENCPVTAAEKIEKLTQYLHERNNIDMKDEIEKKWKYINFDKISINSKDSLKCWRDMQNTSKVKRDLGCPKCLWQCGPIYVSTEYLQKQQVVCED